MTRRRPAEDATERDTLVGMLDFLRATVVRKVAGLPDADAFRPPVPPSTLTAAGVVKHLAGVERFWFSIDFAAADLPWPWPEDDPHGTPFSLLSPGTGTVSAWARSNRGI